MREIIKKLQKELHYIKCKVEDLILSLASKLSNNLSDYSDATLPIEDTDITYINRAGTWFKTTILNILNIILSRNNTFTGNNTFEKNVVIKGESNTIGSALTIKNSANTEIARFQNNGGSYFGNTSAGQVSSTGGFVTSGGNTAYGSSVGASLKMVGPAPTYLAEHHFYTNLNHRMCIKNDGKVGIGTDNPQSILDISSTNSGFLPPRMTEAQRLAIVNPVVSSIIYQTDVKKGLWIYENNGWVEMKPVKDIFSVNSLTGSWNGMVGKDIITFTSKLNTKYLVNFNASVYASSAVGGFITINNNGVEVARIYHTFNTTYQHTQLSGSFILDIPNITTNTLSIKTTFVSDGSDYITMTIVEL